jgi:hypothetical protein
MTQSAQTQFVGVLLPLPLHAAVKTAATQRGETVSAVIRDALAKDIASMTNPKQKPARPA